MSLVRLRQTLEERLEDYNMEPKLVSMQLVLFKVTDLSTYLSTYVYTQRIFIYFYSDENSWGRVATVTAKVGLLFSLVLFHAKNPLTRDFPPRRKIVRANVTTPLLLGCPAVG